MTIAIARFYLRRAQCLGIHNIFGFWIPCYGFQIPGSWFRILCPWNLDSKFQLSVGSRFLELYSRFQGPVLWIPQAKNNFPDSRILIPLQGVIRCLRLEKARCLTKQMLILSTTECMNRKRRLVGDIQSLLLLSLMKAVTWQNSYPSFRSLTFCGSSRNKPLVQAW